MIRNLEVKKVSYEDTKPFLLGIHYAKRMPSISYAYGLVHEENLVGICSFGSPASPSLCKGICGEENKKKVIELNRLVIFEGLPKNTASYFIAKCIKLLPKPLIIVSYADSEMNHIGYIYQASNFLFTGITKKRTDISAGFGKHSRHHKGVKTERVTRSSKYRYVLFHGCNKSITNKLNYPILPYPKGEIKRYEIKEKINERRKDLMDEKNEIIEENLKEMDFQAIKEKIQAKKEYSDYWSNIRRMTKKMIIEEMRKKIMEGSK